uniref:Cold-responsive protein WCOR14 n=1 Tax=Triticum aestivum TaxID=4565 RepID=E6Y8U6_WHEAT|nr:cold-responsive protein WCOR14 [Triticum aestivum]
MASSSVLLGGGAGAAAFPGAAAGKALPRPCFLAARPHTVSGGRLCLQTPPRATPANDAVENVKGAAGEAGDKVSEGADSVSKAAGDAAGKVQEAVEGAVEGAKDLGEKAKQATEEAWDATKDAAQGAADNVTAAVEDVSK